VLRSSTSLAVLTFLLLLTACAPPRSNHIVIGAKNFTEQVVLGELLAQEIEAVSAEQNHPQQVERRFYLAGSYLCHQALISGRIDAYVEYTGTALTAILKQPLPPQPDRTADKVFATVARLYAQRFHIKVEPSLGFENTFAMVIRGDDAQHLHLHINSDLASVASRWRLGVGYEFLERPDGFRGWSEHYALRFASQPSVMDLGLIYRALIDKEVDIVAGNSTDGLIDALHLVRLADDRHYFPPYDAVPIVRRDTLARFPQLRQALSELGGKISEEEMRHLNAEVDANQRDAPAVVRAFREAKGLR